MDHHLCESSVSFRALGFPKSLLLPEHRSRLDKEGALRH
jgi:hypothetical protein